MKIAVVGTGAMGSVYAGLLAGRRSEIDAINAMVPVVAREVGTEAPVNRVISSIVRDLEAAFG